jgi:GAF domain-containing protein
MLASPLHDRLAEIAPQVLGGGTVDLADAEAHAEAGCSVCARALVNARDTAVDLAAVVPTAAPSPALRSRILSAVKKPVSPPPAAPRRFFDPSGEVARLHIGGPGDAERTREVDALAAGTSPEGDPCERLLAELGREIGFPIVVVSIVRGARVGYRVQIGFDVEAGRDRRRETTFCTHTVSGEAPLVVPNAGEEPFFRGSNMVVRYGIRAYVGVPLRTSRGIVIGTLCAMDLVPRAIGPEIVRTLGRYAVPILAEIERGRAVADGAPPAEPALPPTAQA